MLERRTGIAMVALQFSVVVRGLEKKLVDIGYKVIPIENFIDGISKCAEEVELYLVYIPDNIIKDDLKLKQLGIMSKMIARTGKRCMMIGEHNAHDELMDVIPTIGGFMWLDKPVDMDSLEVTMDKALSKETREIMHDRKRILVVDDDPSYAKMVREWMREDYRVDIVTAGMQAISFLLKVQEEEPVDLILLDYEMPVVDGPQVLQMLRQDDLTKNIPVVFLTGNGTKEAVERVMELKPEGYILKSTTRDNLIEYISKKLG